MAQLKDDGFLHEEKRSLTYIIRLRLPWLVLGLAGGILASLLVSNFEEILEEHIALTFFIPVIVYLSAAVGAQTSTLFVREIATRKVSFAKYLLKELFIGLWLGILLGTALGLVALVWIKQTDVALVVGIAMFINILLSPAISMLIAETLYKRHDDPAVGVGPFATVIQDFISLLVYFLVATVIMSGTLLVL